MAAAAPPPPPQAEDPRKRYRHFIFTMNNYQSTDLVDSLVCRYIIYGKEVGERGTPHLQGFVSFKDACTKSAVIRKMPGCHIEVARTVNEAIEYCQKEGDFTERGERPQDPAEQGAAEQERWRAIRLAAEEGREEDIPEMIRFKHARLIEFHRDRAAKRRHLDDTEEKHLWYYGPSGTGKSRKARTDHPAAYLKNCNKWWCGYEDEDTVLIEDFDKKHDMLVHHMKIWADRYPFLAEIKGSARRIRPKLVIVTSNYHPSEIWQEHSDLEPILRRFRVVRFGAIALQRS